MLRKIEPRVTPRPPLSAAVANSRMIPGSVMWLAEPDYVLEVILGVVFAAVRGFTWRVGLGWRLSFYFSLLPFGQ